MSDFDADVSAHAALKGLFPGKTRNDHGNDEVFNIAHFNRLPGAFLLSVQRIKLPDAHVIDKGTWEPMSYSVHGLDAVGLGDSIMEFVHVLFKRFNT
jgi:hypothetical protein